MFTPVQTYNSPLTVVAIQAAYKAGELLRRGFGTELSITTKANAHDLVTECDGAAEALIIEHVRKHYSNHAFLAEESGSLPNDDAPVCWIIDPLDGTLNFAHHIPLFCVSIAAVVGNQVEAGVIYQPMGDEMFVAERGHGAYLNDKRIQVSETHDIHLAIGATGFPYGAELRQSSINQFANLFDLGNPIRILGSAALSLAYVAAARFDAYWSSTLMPWDVAAGKLIVEEAGGTVTHFDGTVHDLYKQQSVVASNTLLHESVLKLLK